eukprot:737405-Rhodomonas_salina.1
MSPELRRIDVVSVYKYSSSSKSRCPYRVMQIRQMETEPLHPTRTLPASDTSYAPGAVSTVVMM